MGSGDWSEGKQVKRKCNQCDKILPVGYQFEAFGKWYCNFACYKKWRLEEHYGKPFKEDNSGDI